MNRFLPLFLVWIIPLAGASDLLRTPVPSWVKTESWTPEAVSRVVNSDYEDLWRDYQVNLDTEEEYVHYAFRFLNVKAVQNDSTVRIDYEPDFQTARLHTLRLWRKGLAIDQTSLLFRSLQRETQLEEAIYDGGETWVAFLRNVQPGDVLEVAYTLKGFNPIFGGRYAGRYWLETSYAVDRWNLRILSTASRRPLEVRSFQTNRQPQQSTVGAFRETFLSVEDLPSVTRDDQTPGDIIAGGWYVLSEWKSWSEVVQWALPLYTPEPSTPILAKARELTQNLADPQAQIVALLEFVQDQIRYLGIEVGVNSHQPHAAEEVLLNGFGDCKDKVVLFCSMAQALGFEAWPMLVHTWAGKAIPVQGPTPLSFNHVIAAVSTPQGPVFVDPTASYQGGSLANRPLDPFAYGLEIRPGVQTLTPLPTPEPGRQDLIQTYYFTGFQDDARVTMDFTFYGSEADSWRRWVENVDLDDWRKNMNERLHDQYGNAQVKGDPAWSDDRRTNVFHWKYEFTLKDFWEKNEDQYEADFYPYLIGENLYDPKEVGARTQPYSLTHPIKVHQVRRIHLPRKWQIDAWDQTITAPGFKLRHRSTLVDPQLIEYTDDFESTSDRVDPDEWEEYLKALEKARNQVSWQLTSPIPSTDVPAPSVRSPLAMQIGVAIVAILLFGISATMQGSDF